MARFSSTLLKNKVRSIPDFPKKGILFRDITPLLRDTKAFNACIDRFVALAPRKVDYVISIESRGFILGSALAYALKAGFVLVRKEGKLPHKTYRMSYELEYGNATLEIHADAMKPGSTAILIDDVLATGGTALAAIQLAEQCGVRVAQLMFLIELKALKGITKLSGYPAHALLTY